MQNIHVKYSRYTSKLQESAVTRANTFHRQQSTVNSVYNLTRFQRNTYMAHYAMSNLLEIKVPYLILYCMYNLAHITSSILTICWDRLHQFPKMRLFVLKKRKLTLFANRQCSIEA